MISLLYGFLWLIDNLISGKTAKFRLRHRYSPDPAWESPSAQLPLLFLGVMVGGKNVEGGSKFPPGRLLDGEAERRTDDNGREADA